MSKYQITHAIEWTADPAVDRVRRRLIEMVADPPRPEPGGWSFALMRRTHPSPTLTSLAVCGFVTLTESGYLTHALIRTLPSPLRLQGGTAEVEIVPLAAEIEVDHEPTPGLLLRTVRGGTHPPGCITALSAVDLPPAGLFFSTALPSPPLGWPV